MAISGISRSRRAAAQKPPEFVEIAVVANGEASTVALVDIASRSVSAPSMSIPRSEERGTGRAELRAGYRRVARRPHAVRFPRVLGDVAAFDIASGQLRWQRSLNTGRADHMTITPDGRSLFVSAMMDNRVYKISTSDWRDRRSSGHRRLSSRQQDLEGWPAVVQHAASARLPVSRDRPVLRH